MTTAPPRVDLRAVADWFTHLYWGTRGYLHVASSDDWAGRVFGVDDAAFGEVAAHIDEVDRRGPQGIYARITTLHSSPGEHKRGGEALTASLPALWADIDVAGPGHRHTPCAGGRECDHLTEAGRPRHLGRVLPLPPDREAARAIVESALLPPATLWVDSGGGMYPIWKLDPVHDVGDDLAEVAALSARWQELITVAAGRMGYHYGTGVGDLSRVLRVPGTWNRKTDTPRSCHVVEISSGTYTLTDLRDLLEQAQALLPTPAPPAPRRPPRDRPGEDVRPGDDFIERVDWSDPLLLGALRWRETYRLPGGERGWLRQGGHSGLSATTGRQGLDNLWVFSTETPFPVQEVISKFEAFRIIHGYPTAKDAALALNRLGFGTPPIAAPNGKAAAGALPPYVWPEDAAPVRPEAPGPNGAHGPAQAAPDLRPERSTEQDQVDPPEDADEEEVDTWLPVDLGPYLRGEIVRSEPDMGLARSDGVRMVYPGKEHAVIGEMESGKGWFAVGSAAAEMLAERHVIYIHFEEADPTDTVERLRSVGCTDHEILTYFHFVGPSRPIKPKQRKRLARMGASLVVLDGVNEGMSLHKAAIREEDGAAEFRRIMVKPFTRNGAAVINLDHVVKDRESRDRYALGSIHKGNALDGALIVLETMEAFGRGCRGASAVYVTKDRPGFLRRHGRPVPNLPGKTFMGVLVVDDTRDRHTTLDLRFWAPADPEAVSDEDEDLRTADEQDDARALAAIRALADKDIPASQVKVEAAAGGKATRVRAALARLVVTGVAVEVSGPRNARLYLAADDPRLTTDSAADRTVADDAP